MLRVIGIQRDGDPSSEFVLLQNQGHMRVDLRGKVLMSESALDFGTLENNAFVVRDDETIGPGLFVMVTTGKGEPYWGKTRDGAYVFHTFMNRETSIWNCCRCPIYVLQAVHTYVERQRTEPLFAV